MSDRDNDLVHVSIGPEYEDGELIPRADLPNDAKRGAGDVQMEDPATGGPRWFEVWVVDR